MPKTATLTEHGSNIPKLVVLDKIYTVEYIKFNAGGGATLIIFENKHQMMVTESVEYIQNLLEG